MTEKYIDLLHRVREEVNYDDDAILTIAAVLKWLDRNPDQVPGRTITESGCHDLYHAAYYGAKAFRGELEDQGFAFIADPEPTNAEKLDKIMEEWPGRATASDPTFGEYLHNRGVKAPGGDDD